MNAFRSQAEQAAWKKVADLDEFHWSDLARFNVADSTAKTFIRRWLQTERVREVRRDGNRVYVTNAEHPRRPFKPQPRVSTPEGNMWNMMRQRKLFTPLDVAAHSNAGGVTVTTRAAQNYCRALLSAGYLRVRQTAVPGVRQATYQLIRDTGPRAPVTARVLGIVDPNEGQFRPLDPELKT